MTESKNTESKINGILLGVVVGDHLGEQVEGVENPGIITKYKPGSRYTDDTEMTLITLQHLLTFQTIKPMSLTIEYAVNATPNRKYGGNAAKTLRKISHEPENWDNAYKEFLQDGSWGNGCLMRITPIALFDLNAPIETLKQHLDDCLKGTHNNDEALQCSIEYCLLIKDLFYTDISNINPNLILQNMINRKLNSRLDEKLMTIKNKIIDVDSCNEYNLLSQLIKTEIVEHGIRASDTLALIVCILIFNLKYKKWTPTHLLSIIISIGGDTDTNAAILGSLLGALYGITWINIDWFNQIENKKFILDKFGQFIECLNKKGIN